jgi:hypothetical protein
VRVLLGTSVVVALAVPSCTLLESRDGLAGPPVSGDAAIVDAGALQDGHAIDDVAIAADAGAATTLYKDEQSPLGIFVDGTFVYWVAGEPRGLLRAPRAGGAASDIVHLDDVNQPVGDAFDLAVDASYVYWSQRGGQITRRALVSGTNEACFSAGSSAAYIAIAGADLFVSDYRLDGTGAIVRGQCGQAPSAIFPAQPRASGVAASAQLVYWGRNDPDQIAFGPHGGANATTFHGVVGAVGGVAVDADAIYWLRENRRVMRFTFVSRVESEIYDAGSPFGDGDIAVDADTIYWTESANGVVKAIKKPPL